PLKTAFSIGAFPASIQLRLPLLTLSVGKTAPSEIHCFNVSRSVSKTPSTVLTRQTSGCALISFVFLCRRYEHAMGSFARREKSVGLPESAAEVGPGVRGF